MHLHAYRMEQQAEQSYKLVLQSRLSTDADGIGLCLGLQAEAQVELEQIIAALQAKISPSTLFTPAWSLKEPRVKCLDCGGQVGK